MKSWTKEQVKDFVNSSEFKSVMDDIEQRLEEYYEEQRRQRAEFWADNYRILHTPMTI